MTHVFLDIDIDECRSRLGLAEWFVENWGESCGLALKGERLEDLKKRAGKAGVRKKMKAVRDAFRTHYMAQQEATKRLPSAAARGETPLLCRTKSADERIVVKLYDDIAPLACKNFIMLAKGVPGDRGRIKIGKGGKPLVCNFFILFFLFLSTLHTHTHTNRVTKMFRFIELS